MIIILTIIVPAIFVQFSLAVDVRLVLFMPLYALFTIELPIYWLGLCPLTFRQMLLQCTNSSMPVTPFHYMCAPHGQFLNLTSHCGIYIILTTRWVIYTRTYLSCCGNTLVFLSCNEDRAFLCHTSPSNPYKATSHSFLLAVGLWLHPSRLNTLSCHPVSL